MADKTNQDPMRKDDPVLNDDIDPSVALERELTMVYLMLKGEVRTRYIKYLKNHPADHDRSSTIRRNPSTQSPVLSSGDDITLQAMPRKLQPRRTIDEFPMGDRIFLQTVDACTDYDQNLSLPSQILKKTYSLKAADLRLNAREKKEIPPPDAVNRRVLNPFPDFEYEKTGQNEVSIGNTKMVRRNRKFHAAVPYFLYRLQYSRQIKPLAALELPDRHVEVQFKERGLNDFPGEFCTTVKQVPTTLRERKKAKAINEIVYSVSCYDKEILLPVTPRALTSPEFPKGTGEIEFKQHELMIVPGKHTAADYSEKIKIASRKIRTKPEKDAELPKSEDVKKKGALKPARRNERCILHVARIPFAPIPGMISTENMPEIYSVRVKDAEIKIENNTKKIDNTIQKIQLILQSPTVKIRKREISKVFLDDSVIQTGNKVVIGKTQAVSHKQKHMVISNGRRRVIIVRKLGELTCASLKEWNHVNRMEISINPAKDVYDDIMKEMGKYKEHIETILKRSQENREKLEFLNNFTPLTSEKLMEQWDELGGPEALRQDFVNM